VEPPFGVRAAVEGVAHELSSLAPSFFPISTYDIPSSIATPINSLEQAIDVANGVAYGLSASIYTRNVNRAFQATRDLYTGIVYVNAPTIGAETHLPFGGTKQTGNGHREAAIAAIDFFTEWKTIYIDYSDKLQRAQIDNN